ncbi:MAG TPA: RluA family pseudouridine synthase [Solirubrobacteraceae bacterium]|jgi:23S rRNA pseudouridine1911/1915/1917 synthase|nr:RluA family pseudouridine synthase [Solirubrobacteraceae bacterium]
MPGDPRLRLEVPPAAGGVRLDRFLAEPLGSRAKAQTLIDSQRVRVDGRIRPKRHLVSAGELIDVEPGEAGPVEVEEVAARFEVPYEDEHLLVVDKPAGVVVHPARGHWSGTLAQALSGRGAGGDEPWRAGIVHRLDRDTSGLLVVAKSDEVHRALKEELKHRKLHREYLALVEGRPPARTGTVEAPIGRHRRERTLMSIDTAEPREARTHFELERALPDSTLLRVVLDTGRTHQIRVHMAAIGHPVAGDPQYGTRGLYGLERQFLHAARLAFAHPVTGEAIEVASALPPDLVEALARAGDPAR